MTEEQLGELFFLLVRVLTIIVLIFNAGVGVILLRQIATMNAIIKVRSPLIIFLVTGFIFVVIISLLYAILA